MGQPHRLGVVAEPLPSPAGVTPQAGPGTGLGRVARRVRAGLAGEGARGGFAAAQVAGVGGVPGLAVLASAAVAKSPSGAGFPVTGF